MTSTFRFITRRGLLGVMAVGIVGPQSVPGQTASSASAKQENKALKIRLEFGDHRFDATLEDNPSTRDFTSMLPLDELTIDDYADNEKISYLPRKITERGSGPFGNETPGDICYYAPWGNLALFYSGYRWSSGLIRLGRIDGSFAPLLTRGKFPLRIGAID